MPGKFFDHYWLKAVLMHTSSFSQERSNVDLFSFTAEDLTGKNVSLEQHRGNVILLVNVATY